MHPRTRLVYLYFLRVELLLKTWSQSRRHIVRLPWQRYICRSKYGCFCISPKVTYLHTKIEEVLKFFISNFASLSSRIALNVLVISVICWRFYRSTQNLSSSGRKLLVIPLSRLKLKGDRAVSRSALPVSGILFQKVLNTGLILSF